jgi:phosphatidylserine/phosphatidylglycerophosphate/cardiolipin synthase-like enzyme
MTQLGYGLLHHYKKRYVIILGIIISWLILVSVFHMIKPLSLGIDYTGKVREVSADNVSFLYDLTYNKGGTRVHEQHIFDKIFSYIQGAKKYILIDMFLFNSHLGNSRLSFRKISEELVEQLIDAKEREPNLKIDVITDPINILYGGAGSSEIDKLKKYGISVVITDLKSLRDSNPLYSSFWRTFIQWFGNSHGGWFPNPFSATGPRVSLRTYLAMINFKANHRKIFMADSGESYVSIIMSANPHDASSSHSNVALEVRGDLSQDLYITESGVASFSNMQLAQIDIGNTYDEDNELLTQLVTEKAIRKTILDEVGSTVLGDNISIAMFYLAERKIIKALIDASNRGVNIRIILDPNKDAFGYEKIGVPNRPVASEIISKTKGKIQVRWYDTKGEQFHSKLIFIEHTRKSVTIMGSANLTRRNLCNYNLESDVMLQGDGHELIFADVRRYFDRIWSNQDGNYTIDYNAYRNDSFFKVIIYYIQEKLGLSSF